MWFILPAVVAIVIFLVTLFLRKMLYRFFRIWAAKTQTRWDDIMVGSTWIASLLWCLSLSLYGGFVVSQFVTQLPASWEENLELAIPAVFVALAIYTITVIITGTIKWYRIEVCPKTVGTMDNKLMAVLQVAVPVIAGILGILVILSILGIKIPAVSDWLTVHGGKIVFFLILGIVLLLSTVLIIPKIIQTSMRSSKGEQTEEELKKRTETLVNVIVTSLQVVIIVIILLMFLSEIGINISSILVGAGVVSIAIGFGAQSLVKDLIAGLFIIMENQYRKGDVVKIADISGLVEEINLRRTILRDLDGITHVVPNGEIRVASNFTKLWSRVNLNISVSYGTDLDKAREVINLVGRELAEDPKWAPDILTPPQVLRVDNLGASGIDIKILGDTKPIRQWDVMGELRLRLKKAFDQEGIEIPWPHTKVYFGNSPEGLRPKDSKKNAN
jgi:small-conductance mechanosensitive channel